MLGELGFIDLPTVSTVIENAQQLIDIERDRRSLLCRDFSSSTRLLMKNIVDLKGRDVGFGVHIMQLKEGNFTDRNSVCSCCFAC